MKAEWPTEIWPQKPRIKLSPWSEIIVIIIKIMTLKIYLLAKKKGKIITAKRNNTRAVH